MFGLQADMVILILASVFALMLAVFIVVLVSIAALTHKEEPVKDRLYMMKHSAHDARMARLRRSEDPFEELTEALINFAGPVSRNMYEGNKKLLANIKKALSDAGEPDSESHIWRFLALQVGVGLVSGAVLFVLVILFTQDLMYAMIGAIGGMLVFKNIPLWILKIKAKKRQAEISFKLPDTIDLMVVCVEAGLALDSTIKRVADETEKMAPELSSEFKRLNRELNAGITRLEAFQNLANRCGVDEMKSLCAMIIQSDKLGTSISKTLRIYADDMRTKRRQKAEELASKASIKMTFVLALFIFPSIFVVLIGGPALEAIGVFGI